MSATARADELRDRSAFFDGAQAFTPFVAASTEHGTFLVSTGDEAVARFSLFMKGERGEMSMVARSLAVLRTLGLGDRVAGKAFVDVGANIGTSTVTALLEHPFASAIALEPEPSNHRLLKLNMVLNDLDHRVRSLQVAVSDTNGTIELRVHARNSGGHEVVTDPSAPKERPDLPVAELLTVERVTLDYLVERGLMEAEEVGLIWIDAQGHEGHILRGAEALVKRATPVVLEFFPRMLARAGGLEMLEAVIQQHYTHFADVRKTDARGPSTDWLLPVSDIRAFAEEFEAESSDRRFTDILIVGGLPPGAGAAPKVEG